MKAPNQPLEAMTRSAITLSFHIERFWRALLAMPQLNVRRHLGAPGSSQSPCPQMTQIDAEVFRVIGVFRGRPLERAGLGLSQRGRREGVAE